MKIGACVYLLFSNKKDAFKVGITTQMPQKRINQIAAKDGNPWKERLNPELTGLLLCESIEIARIVEVKLLKIAKEQHLIQAGNEWLEELDWFIEDLLYDKFNTKIWGWRDLYKFMESLLEYYHQDRDERLYSAKHDSGFAQWVADNLIESFQTGDTDNFQFFAQKQSMWKPEAKN